MVDCKCNSRNKLSSCVSHQRLSSASPTSISSSAVHAAIVVFDHRQPLIMHKFICMCTTRELCGSRMKRIKFYLHIITAHATSLFLHVHTTLYAAPVASSMKFPSTRRKLKFACRGENAGQDEPTAI